MSASRFLLPIVYPWGGTQTRLGLLNRPIFRGKNCTSTSVRVHFSSEKSYKLTDHQDMFCLIAHPLSKRATISRKTLINNKFEAQTLIGNSTGNLRCHALGPLALNMSCSFGRSACSIESRCVVERPRSDGTYIDIGLAAVWIANYLGG